MPDAILCGVVDWRAVVGKNVRQARREAGLTQEKVALDADIDLTYMGGIERGKRNPSLLVLVRIAEAVGVRPDELLRN